MAKIMTADSWIKVTAVNQEISAAQVNKDVLARGFFIDNQKSDAAWEYCSLLG